MKKESFDRDVFGEDLRPNYGLKTDPIIRVTAEEIPLNYPPETLKEWAKKERDTLIRRKKIFNEKPEYFNEIQMIDIEKINDELAAWNLFELPSKIEQEDLMRSIANVGLLSPIYITLHTNGVYNVIIGRCRLIAYCNLYESTGLDVYRYIPCYVIPFEETDELFIRSIMIESNISFRKISKMSMIKALLENYEAMKITKQYRNELNIGTELSKQFQISESTVFNYLKVRRLCDPAKTLLYDDEISIQAATYLSMVSMDVQEKILETCGKEGVNAIFRLKLLTRDVNITVEQLQRQIESVNKMLPQKTRITIEVSQALLNPLMQHLLDFKRKTAAEKACFMQGKFKDVFNVRFKVKDLEYYRETGTLDEVVLKKLMSKNLTDMSKIK